MKTQNIFSRILYIFIILVFIGFFASAGFQDKSTSGWYQQWFPNLNGSTIKDITFLDSLTGFAVTNANTIPQSYILKTTNGGDNWFINYTFNPPYSNWNFIKVFFLDLNTGFAFSDDVSLFTTTNGGQNWNIIENGMYPEGAAVLNKDTMLIVTSNGFDGGVYRSTNGGNNWQLIWTNGSAGNPNKIYMYDKNLGFSCNDNSSYFRRTTNGGMNWTNITEDAYSGIKFYDSLIGWKGSVNGIRKTTNGGVNWFSQNPPSVFYFRCDQILVINKDTIWFTGCTKLVNNNERGILCKTTNSGLNWGYQIPDTSINIYDYYYASSINKNNLWAYFSNSGIHTKVGGNDTTYYTAINNNATTLPEDYIMYQNFPNPFNPNTNIKYKILKSSYISIDITDMLGRNIITLVDRKHLPGNYEVKFNGEKISSGIYFYTLKADNKIIQTRKMLLMK